jgi:pilus assembly protein Flp/PilA
MKSLLRKLIQDATGTSAIEYGLICAMLVLAMMTALQGVSNESNLTWSSISEKTRNAIDASNGG